MKQSRPFSNSRRIRRTGLLAAFGLLAMTETYFAPSSLSFASARCAAGRAAIRAA
jgi:hypothetical protein